MRASHRRSLLLALLLAGVGAWLATRTPSDRLERAGARPPRAASAGATLDGRPALEGTAAPGRAPRPGGPSHRLTIRLRGVSASQAPNVTLTIRDGTPFRQVTEARWAQPSDASGTTVVDVTGLVNSGPTWLMLTADGPAHLPVYEAVEVPADPALRAHGLELEVTLEPRPAAVVRGLVLAADGRPAIGALVVGDRPGGFADESERLPSEPATTDMYGRFSLRMAVPGPAVLLALDPGDTLALSVPFEPSLAAPTDVGTLRLERGLTQRGRVRGCPEPRSQARVVATWLGPTRFAALPGVVWAGERPIHEQRAAPISEDGAYELTGLEPGRWSLAVQAQDWGCALAAAVRAARQRVVSVPGAEVAFDVSRALQRVIVSGSEGPLENALVQLSGPETIAFTTDGGGHGALVLPPRTRVQVTAWREDALAAGAELITAGPGEESVARLALAGGMSPVPDDLAWVSAEARFSLHLRDLLRGGGPAAVVLTDAAGGAVPVVWREQAGVVRWRSLDRLLGAAGADALTALPPGPYRIEVRGECCEWGDDLDLPAVGAGRLEVVVGAAR